MPATGTDFIGGIRFYEKLSIDASEMKDWPVERIRQFFDGLTQAIRASNEPSFPLLFTYVEVPQ